MNADSYLAIAGGLLFISGIASFVLDRRSERKTRWSFSVDGLIRFLGILGLVAVFCLGFGLLSWAISVVYWFVISSVAGSR
jgi:uncharacterized membrane protein HdeD (DUF308 family)